MTTQITEYDKKGFEGLKFEYVCNDKYLTTQTTSQEAIDWFKDFTGEAPQKVVQVSRYPSRS